MTEAQIQPIIDAVFKPVVAELKKYADFGCSINETHTITEDLAQAWITYTVNGYPRYLSFIVQPEVIAGGLQEQYAIQMENELMKWINKLYKN